jgi:plasmid stabilization system protein ParE
VAARQKKRLEWSRRSAQDLLNIEAYIAVDNQPAADAVIAHVRERALLLETDSLLGKRRLASPHRELVLSRFPYTIIYRVRGSQVFISRVLHQRRQFP